MADYRNKLADDLKKQRKKKRIPFVQKSSMELAKTMLEEAKNTDEYKQERIQKFVDLLKNPEGELTKKLDKKIAMELINVGEGQCVVDNLEKFTGLDRNQIIELFDGPFPKHVGYTKVWKKLDLNKKNEMKENIRITDDGKIEIIKMKKKFSILDASLEEMDIKDPILHCVISGNYKDKNGQTGLSGMTYFVGKSSEKIAKKQHKKFLHTDLLVEQFMLFFPGDNLKEKIYNFTQLFGLEKTGCFFFGSTKWEDVGLKGYVSISSYLEVGYKGLGGGNYGVIWTDKDAEFTYNHWLFSGCPSISYEDC